MLDKFHKDEKGAAMLMGIIGLALISMITITMIFMGSSNARQTQREGRRTQAYYVADTAAKTLVAQLQDETKYPPDKLKDELSKMSKRNDIKGEYRDWEFEIDVIEKVKDEVYEIRTTAEVDEVKDGTTMLVTLGNVSETENKDKGEGYEIGNGKIFLNRTSKNVIPGLPQLTGAGVSIYTNGERHMESESSIFISEDKHSIKELFTGVKVGNNTIEEISKQRKGNYGIEILQTTSGELTPQTVISNNNLIKREKLVKYVGKGNIKDKTFEEIDLRYSTTKNDVLSYFSKGKLSTKDMTDAEVKKGLKSTFLIPITTVEKYRDYIKGKDIYPSKANYTVPVTAVVKGSIDMASGGKQVVDFKGIKDIKLKNIILNNGADLTIDTSGDTNIFIDGNISIDDSKMNEKITINADGKVNFYIGSTATIDGKLIVVPKNTDVEVNFYIYNGMFQSNNKAIIKGINLYVPNHKVQFKDVEFEGVIVTKEIQMNGDSTFKAPSSGPASKDNNIDNEKSEEKGSKVNIEWKEWQR